MTTFNSREYEWSNVKVFMLGRFITGLQGVSYTARQEKGYVYGTGTEPRAIQHGNRSYVGRLQLLQSELEALITAAPKRDILTLQFDLTVSYTARGEEGRIVTDLLKYCEFSEMAKSMAQNEKMMEVDLPIIFLRLAAQA